MFPYNKATHFLKKYIYFFIEAVCVNKKLHSASSQMNFLYTNLDIKISITG